jgi:hypothetical protein
MLAYDLTSTRVANARFAACARSRYDPARDGFRRPVNVKSAVAGAIDMHVTLERRGISNVTDVPWTTAFGIAFAPSRTPKLPSSCIRAGKRTLTDP